MSREFNRIRFHFVCPPFYFPGRTGLKDFVIKLFKKEGYELEAVNYIFCTDEYLLNLNRSYLDHDTYTDIITFGFSKGKEPVAADIYISVERVRENARLFHSGFLHELHRVIFHGALHLCGYRDKTAGEVKEMRAREEFYLKRFFVPRETKSSKS